jgi:endonuclease/exonuclease/phosphatase family metal-dependent hydrolase
MVSHIGRLGWLLPPLALLIALAGCRGPAEKEAAPHGTQEYLFCFWNTENFFDDQEDGRPRQPDKTFDAWFANNPEVLKEKLDHLTEVLAEMNGGAGPDILAIAEAESERAVELLRDSLNKAIKKGTPYKHIAWKDPKGGRHIATAVISRLPIIGDRTQLHGRRLRILESHVEVNGHDLAIMATHWTSRVSDDSGEGRDKYADLIYGRFRAMYKSNPKVDLIICGDFNDNPDDDSVVEHLHATGDRAKVLAGEDPPMLYGLFSDLWAKHEGKEGSHYYRGHAYIFDQLVVSPGMLDTIGWSCEPETAKIHKHRFVDRHGRPDRFGTQRDKGVRGASDHFPVTVELKVAAKGE